MATVAADAILGYATGRALRLPGRWTLYLIGMANLPDADYLPGLLAGDPSSTHRDIGMHTPYFAVVVGLVVVLAFHRWRRYEGWEQAVWAGTLSALMVLGHLVLDRLDLPYWHATGWAALIAEAVNSLVDTAIIGPVVLAIFWVWNVRVAGSRGAVSRRRR